MVGPLVNKKEQLTEREFVLLEKFSTVSAFVVKAGEAAGLSRAVAQRTAKVLVAKGFLWRPNGGHLEVTYSGLLALVLFEHRKRFGAALGSR